MSEYVSLLTQPLIRYKWMVRGTCYHHCHHSCAGRTQIIRRRTDTQVDDCDEQSRSNLPGDHVEDQDLYHDRKEVHFGC